ncbi:transfer protein spdA [Streptomyces sp. NPDC001221]
MKTDSILKWSALLAAMYLSFSAEYALALECGFSRYTAPAFPVALDLFMIWSVRQRRAVAASVLAVVAFNVSAHLPLSGRWLVVVTVAAAVAAPLIVWAMHVRPRVRASEGRSAIPADGNPSEPVNGPQVAAGRLSESDPVAVADEFWSDFLATDSAVADSAPDNADSDRPTPDTAPPTPDAIRAAIDRLSAAGQRVTGPAIAREFNVSERTGRRYLAMAA